jgi:NDP-sugar pyrophosphorylase family protein
MTDPTPERIDAVVLAGGLGTRLRSVVSDRPKPMAEVGGRPFLDLVLRNLRRVPGIGTVVLAVSHMAERIVEEYTHRSDLGFGSTSPWKRPAETGGAIRNALSGVRIHSRCHERRHVRRDRLGGAAAGASRCAGRTDRGSRKG